MEHSKNPIIRFVQEAFEELHKTKWPTKREAFNLFMIVSLITIIVIAFVTILDWLFAEGYKFLIS